MKKITLFIFALLMFSGIGLTQKIDTERLKGLKIRNIGPGGMSGRVTTIDVNLQDDDIIYAGTASGGVWKSMSGGIDWEPIFDKEATVSIGALAINQKNPSEVWVGTGEGNPRNSHNSGGGIYKTLDGGRSWMLMGLEKTRTIHRILIHPENPQIVYVAALGTIWGTNEERGVYKTTDGGQHWEQVLYINESVGCADLVIDPSNPNKLIAAMWEYGRKPWTFNSGGDGSGMYVTHDGGQSWKERTHQDGLPKGKLGRMGLAIAPSKPSVVYALIEGEKENAIYRSEDGGFQWKKRGTKDIGNRPFYYADIFVDSKNENRLYSIFSLVNISEDGGQTFETLLPYYGVHPDHHAWWIHPDDPSYIIDGNDGGLNISRDGGRSWRFIENIPVAQFYHISHDMSIPYRVGGGMQDNGSWVGPSMALESGGIRNAAWQEIFFGDGFDVLFHPSDQNLAYAMSQGGNLGLVDMATGKSTYIRPTHPDTIDLRFNWNAAIAQDPFNDCGVYYGSQFLHKSVDCGQSWEILSPDLTTNDTTKQKQDASGGLTIDATGAENFTTIVSIAPSPVDENVIWVGTDDGNLQLTKDGGTTWTNLGSKLKDVKSGAWIPQIVVSGSNPGEALIVVNDYRRDDWRPFVFHTKNYGATISRIVDEKQVDGYAHTIVQDPIEPNLLWLGTDRGLYLTIDGGKNWNKWMNDYPSVPTIDLKIHPREHDLIVGTFGRAAWILDDIRPIRALAQTKGEVLNEPFSLFPAPDAYQFETRSYQGIRFGADALYSGDNRNARGAMLTTWLHPDSIKIDDKKQKVKVEVFDEAGLPIRTYTTRLDTGINRMDWNMRMDGVRFPSRSKEPKEDEDLPSGMQVMPGTYKVVMSFNDYRDSTMITIHHDPRIPFNEKDREAYDSMNKKYEGYVAKTNEVATHLREAGKSIKIVESIMSNLEEEDKKAFAEETKAIKKRLSEVQDLIFGPEDPPKGKPRVRDYFTRHLYGPRRYMRSMAGGQSQAVQRMMNKVKIELNEVLVAVDEFFMNDFAKFKEMVDQKEKPAIFKPYEAMKIEE